MREHGCVTSLSGRDKEHAKKFFTPWQTMVSRKNQPGAPVLKRLFADLSCLLSLTDNKVTFEGSDEAGERNAKQIKKNEQPATIWHAVSHYNTKEGKGSWEICKLIMDGCRWVSPWMLGKDRGIFGETPLHLALLFSEPTEEYLAFFEDLWSKCPRLHAEQYIHPLYAGENALHIAIIRKVDMRIIRTMVESPKGAKLLEQRATGTFFKDPRLSDGCCSILGEYPLCFAACTNQMAVFDYLLSSGANPTARTSENNTLLHLLVLNTDPSLPPSGDAADAPCIYIDIYDQVEARLRAAGVYEQLRTARNGAGHTPLSLAAAVGSEAMFEHLFRKELAVSWTFGPAICRRLDLAGIDVPLTPHDAPSVLEVAAARRRARAAPHPRPPAPPPCALLPTRPRRARAGAGAGARGGFAQVLVECGRKDVLTRSLMDKVRHRRRRPDSRRPATDTRGAACGGLVGRGRHAPERAGRLRRR
jgi:hypothetical protein